MPVGPRSFLPPESAPWGRHVDRELADLGRRLDRTGTDGTYAQKVQTATFNRLSTQVKQQAESIELLSGAVQTLLDLSTVVEDEFTVGVDGFAGWYSGSLPEVEIESPTGRIEVGYGGSANSGDAYFCFSITGGAGVGTVVDRDDIQTNPAKRVAVTGGASFAPSGWKTAVIDVPPEELLTVKLEVYAGDAFTYIFGGSIQARVTL